MIDNLCNESVRSRGLTFIHSPKGSFWGAHRDGTGHDHNLNGWHLWGGVIYLEDFEGGDIVYPEENKRYHPKKGDFLLHGSLTLHHIEEVKSDKRYTISLLLWKEKKD